MRTSARICLVGISLLVAAGGCGKDPNRLTWKWSFSPRTIEAGRDLVWPPQPGAMGWSGQPITVQELRADTSPPTPTPAPAPSIAATKADVLRTIRDGHTLKMAVDRSAAFDALRALGEDAIEPLIAILHDDAVNCEYADTAARMLVTLGCDSDDQTWAIIRTPADQRRLTPHANRIVDELVAYEKRRPEASPVGIYLAAILPLDRLPEVIEWAEASSGMAQRDYIQAFCLLTCTDFPKLQKVFCGQGAPASMETYIRNNQGKQIESLGLMRKWWAANGSKPYSQWVIDSLHCEIEAGIESQRRWIFEEYKDDPEYQTMLMRQLPNRGGTRLGAYVFEPLRQELEQAPDFFKPYVLGLIGSCDHPQRDSYVAGYLESPDLNLQYVAVEILPAAAAREHIDSIRRILQADVDARLQELVIEKLAALSDDQSLGAIVQHLTSDDYRLREAAEKAVSRLLVDHGPKVEQLAKSHGDKAIRERMTELVKRNKAQNSGRAADSDGREQLISEARNLLRSSDADSRRLALRLIHQHRLGELIPECIGLLPAVEETRTRSALADVISRLGVPGLCVANADELLGYSLRLDQAIAFHCYAKEGRNALSLVRRVAFEWRDPVRAKNPGVGSPSERLSRILAREDDPTLDSGVISLLHALMQNNKAYDYWGLAHFLSPGSGASLVDALLKKKDRYSIGTAIYIIRDNQLRDYAGTLIEQIDASHTSSRYAAEALIEFGHPDAWSAAAKLLEGNQLRSNAFGMSMPGAHAAYGFGVALRQLRDQYRDDIHRMLIEELGGEMRRRIVVALTAAFATQPDPADREVLLAVAQNQDAPRAAQMAAAVALSDLGDRAALPTLRRSVRECLGQDCAVGRQSCEAGEFFWTTHVRRDALREEFYSSGISLDMWSRNLGIDLDAVQSDPSDMIGAMRRLGDDSMTEELVDALLINENKPNYSAYQMLLDLKGMEGYRLARARIAEVDPGVVDRFTREPRDFLGVEMTRDEALELLTYDKFNLLDEALLILKYDLRESSDRLVELFSEIDDRYAPFRATIVDILCRFGDRRGLDLATEDPFLFLQLVDYLDEPPVRPSSMWFNRVEDALRLIDWYRGHRESLKWDEGKGKFALTQR